ncbi:MAG: OB-fold domain-containing protein, partial [Chloroflexota bacterium]|nr:OB-fold domain-containing protein [Chloroflexota bacterium]
YALVELDEGPLFGTNIVGIDPHQIKVGMPVEVSYDDITPEWTLPKFKPVGK